MCQGKRVLSRGPIKAVIYHNSGHELMIQAGDSAHLVCTVISHMWDLSMSIHRSDSLGVSLSCYVDTGFLHVFQDC